MTPSFRTLIAAAAVALAFAGVISASASPPAAAATPAGACADDANATQVLSSAEGQKAFGGPVSCAVLAAMHVCNHPTHGARVREHCTATCGACPDSTCDPDDATVDAATDVNTTAAVRGDDDDDDSSSSLTWGQYLYKQLAAANAAKDVLQRAVDLSLAANKVLADKVSAAEGKADSAAEQVVAMQRQSFAEKAANKVLADAVSAAEGKADGAAEQVAAMQKELDAVKVAKDDSYITYITYQPSEQQMGLFCRQLERNFYARFGESLQQKGMLSGPCKVKTATTDCQGMAMTRRGSLGEPPLLGLGGQGLGPPDAGVTWQYPYCCDLGETEEGDREAVGRVEATGSCVVDIYGF